MSIHVPIVLQKPGIEIDFFPVGDAGRSGDAIVIRFGNLHGPIEEQRIVVVDGGFTDDGEAIADYLDEIGATHVDLVISTHPDVDHITGLRQVLDRFEVHELWMHLPWDHTDDIASMFHDGRVTDNSVSDKLRDELNGAHQLFELAEKKGVPIQEPFTGTSAFSGMIQVVGPDLDFYEKMLLDFRSTPERARSSSVSKVASAFWGLRESFSKETLTNRGNTSAENNTSVITYIQVGDCRALLTGDAGIAALENAADELESAGAATQLTFIQVPHHGSKHNVGPTVLDRIVGPRQSDDTKRLSAFISAAPEGEPKHPSRQVTNAFRRRGAHPFVTQGRRIYHHHNAPSRSNWTAITPIPFYEEVDEDDES